MKKSHIVFIIVSVVWVGGFTINLLVSEPELFEQYGIPYFVGYTFTHFLILAAGYCVYLFIQNRRAKTVKS